MYNVQKTYFTQEKFENSEVFYEDFFQLKLL